MAEHRWFGLRTLTAVFVLVILMPLSPVLLTQRWAWWETWAFATIVMISFFGSRFLANRRHPGILDERAKLLDHHDTEPFDKVLAPVLGIGVNVIPLFAGLEVKFLGAVDVSPIVAIAALTVIAAGYTLGGWALVENRFFSTTVRIQAERDHVVVDTGPYRFVRHPGYAGGLLWVAATPFLFGTYRTGIFASVLSVALVVRTMLEDRTLIEKLPGYAEYAKKTRFRLVPGVW